MITAWRFKRHGLGRINNNLAGSCPLETHCYMAINITETEKKLLSSFYETLEYDFDDHIYREQMLLDFMGYLNKHLSVPVNNPDATAFLAEENRRLRISGCKLAEAALRVAREYDGVHRLLLAVSVWAKTVADEGGRGEDI